MSHLIFIKVHLIPKVNFPHDKLENLNLWWDVFIVLDAFNLLVNTKKLVDLTVLFPMELRVDFRNIFELAHVILTFEQDSLFFAMVFEGLFQPHFDQILLI